MSPGSVVKITALTAFVILAIPVMNAENFEPFAPLGFAGISAAGACWVALEVAKQVENATIVFIVCDRGDRYLSTGVFPA